MGLISRRNSRRKKPEDPAGELRAVLGDTPIPTFPGTVLGTLEALRSPRSEARDVGRAMSADPGLTVRLLKLVNSAGFGLGRPIDNVEQAVSLAGFGAVESLVLSVGVTSALPRTPVDGLDLGRFWLAAGRRAAIARALAEELHPATAGLSFTAGLLQDMAIPLLAVAREDYRPLLLDWHGGGDELHVLESNVFGWTHCEIAEWLAGEWGLPTALTDAISGHHGLGEREVPPAVQLAAPFREVPLVEIRDDVIARVVEGFGLTSERVEAVLDGAEQDAAGIAAQLF